jgi:hypothetical protein
MSRRPLTEQTTISQLTDPWRLSRQPAQAVAAESGGGLVDTRRASAFEHCALASGLLKPDQLDEAWAALCPAEGPPAALDSLSDERLAEKVVQLGWLNRWQSKQLLEGRTKFNLGLYWMVDSIGRGGMGQVFKA